MSGGNDTEEQYRDRIRWDAVTWGTHCANCLSTCSYRVYASGGRVRWEEQAGRFPATEPGVPDRNPMGCQKGAAWHRQIDSGDRVTRPLRRAGERGEGLWNEVSWDEALTEVADAVLDAIEESGPEAVLVDEGPEGGMLTIGAYMHFANLLGAVSLDGNATVNDFPAGHYLTFGTMAGGSGADDTFHADVVLIWHANPAYTRIPYFHYLAEARYRGAEVVTIAPDLSPSAVHADVFVPVVPGSDAALALGMCHVVVEEGLTDEGFVRHQTDLPLLVRTDTGRLLRGPDVEGPGAPEDRFYVWDGAGAGLTAVVPERLSPCPGAALAGEFAVALAAGGAVAVTPVMALLRERLGGYTPEAASAHCGVHPDVIRTLARKVARGRAKVHEGFDTAKHYHGDLMERSMDLLLALTGNWGRTGTGLDTFCAFSFDGAYLLDLKGGPGLEAAESALAGVRAMTAAASGGGEQMPPAAYLSFLATAGLMGATTPVFWFWRNHCGYDEMWDHGEWGDSPRPLGEYVAEAEAQWAPLIRPRPGQTPRVLIEAGTNALRRTRGGSRMLLDHLWPQLALVVSVDSRINTTGMYADVVLPAAHEAERVNLQYPISHSMELVFSDRAVVPAGEARSDWQIFGGIMEAVARRAAERGMGEYTVGRVRARRLDSLGDAFFFGGALRADEALVDEIVRDSALAGVVDEDCSLAKLREDGWARVVGNGAFPSGRYMGTPIDPGRTHCGFRWHVEEDLPFATLTGRATFYVDHPWFLEAGEALPCHKAPPATGGDHPFVLTGGHPRWSIHACNATNPLVLETTRGHPTLVVNSADAAARGIGDDERVRVRNDLGGFVVNARLSGAVRPGQVVLYASWEPYGFEAWGDGTRVEAGMVKPLHLATGWGHLRYTPFQWQPAPFDRLTRVDVEPAD